MSGASGIKAAVAVLAATITMSVYACAEWQPFYQPPPPATPATAAPEAPAVATTPGNDAAAIAIEKANRAALKAAEAAKVAAEASAAAHDAAAAAARASHGTLPPARRGTPSTASANLPSRGSSNGSAHATPDAASTPTIISDSSSGHRDEAVRSVDAATASIGRIDHTRLSGADAKTYALAVDLLDSAQKALTRKEYAAAASLSHKANILLGTIHTY